MIHHQDPDSPPKQHKKTDVPLDDTLQEKHPEKDPEQTNKDAILIIALSRSQTHNYRTPTTPPLSELPAEHTIIHDPRTRTLSHDRHRHSSNNHPPNPHGRKEKQLTSPTPTRAKHNRIFEWLQGMISMSSFTNSDSKTRESNGGKSSSVEVVVARDAKGKGKGIRIVSDEVEEGTGLGGEEGEV